ncbi:hypothetical protein MJ588_24750 [Klebsiella pneumoniae]|nr:hypothetical protein MJ588_24750 [Klebsiella pneumoniae]
MSQEEMDDDEGEGEEEDADDSSDVTTTASTLNWRVRSLPRLRTRYEVTRDTIKAEGRSHAPPLQGEILKLSEVFKQ